ncbi:allantoate amidohydrolase [Mangrovimicrobium sediminis]|uniref:Allantoate amidohydrolase n=1 Tax=Mangrovimicrobium sediminis TaxID=2562682 RepID=A0A4Z0M4I9_9GAMM|nr:allantoate amidohydrolase [Haliea sp. SAOS-164]TGD74603.1 allantoate amidohydrolase [Haliea sp. SAOS-164]
MAEPRSAPGPNAVYAADACLPGAQRVMQRCDLLATYSAMPNAVSRGYLTAEHQQCNATVRDWMGEAGMHCWQDHAGNIWGRLPCDDPAAPTVIIGSHLDSVPNAGKYDGILGVVLAVEALGQLASDGHRLPFHVDLVGFGDEEGSRFGTTLMGSRAVAGRWNDDWLKLTDVDGITLESALLEFGCDTAAIGACDRSGEALHAYLEVHIEQGPLLEEKHQPLGVVTSIAGARRFVVNIRGRAGHAGTVPMDMRQDALVAGASAVSLVESTARHYEIVATVGALQCWPGAPNVIAGDCRLTIDIRSGRDQTRDLALAQLQEEIDAMVKARKMQVEWTETHNASAVSCASHLQRTMEDVLQDMGLTPVSLVSGAGHDAMSFDGITDIGMLFVRCAGGISHHPAESVEVGDVGAAGAALMNTLLAMARQYQQVGESGNG